MSGALRLANPLGNGVPNPGTTGGAGPGGPAAGAPPPPPGGNPLMPGGPGPNGPGAGNGGMPTSLADIHQTLHGAHGQAKAAYDQTGKALGILDHMRQGLERLADKGDMVTPEDIISEAGKLVAHGIDPMALAGVLAEMPEQGGGEALGGWVMSHAIQAAQAEQQVMAAHEAARHQMGVTALHVIMAHDAGHRAPMPGSEPMADGDTNPLTQGPSSGNVSALAMGQKLQ
jgi:hypothetical protein